MGGNSSSFNFSEPVLDVQDIVFEEKTPGEKKFDMHDEPDKKADADEEKIYVHGQVDGDNIFYKTSDVAAELGMSDQDIRNYAQYFSDYLAVQKTVSGHRRFTRKNIEQLRSIIELKHVNGFTMEQTKDALATEEGQILVAKDEPERLKKLMEWTLNQMSEMMQANVSIAIDERMKAVVEATKTTQTMLLEDAKSKKENVEMLNELKKQLDDNSKAMDEMRSMITALSADNKEKDLQVKELKEQNNQILEETRKKKGFLFWK